MAHCLQAFHLMDLLSLPTGFLSLLTMVVVKEGTDEQTA
jgi:hypothetical protein